ncbi:MAG: BON domain-containing protein [Planctomycetota bacterium]|nr:BON domain-containing protein [Planctomycetota bacterium]
MLIRPNTFRHIVGMAFGLAVVAVFSGTCAAQGTGGTGGLGGLGGLGGGGNTGAGGGGGGGTGGAGGGAAGTGIGGQQAISQGNTFRGFTANLGGTSVPFSTTQGLSGTNRIGSLSGSTTQTGAGALGAGGLGGSGIGGALGGTGLGGGLAGGFGVGLGGGLGGGFGGSRNTRSQFGGGGSQTTAKQPIKATFKPVMDAPPTTTIEARNNQIQSRLQRLPLAEKYRGVSVEIAGRTAILSGSTATEAEARYVERLVSIEAGIDRVENRIQFAASPTRNSAAESVPALRAAEER